MNDIPLYLKTESPMARPKDPEYYLLTRDGMFFCRNHAFFESDVPASRSPRMLAPHERRCAVRYPKLSVAALEFIIGFFDRVYEEHRAESVVLLTWDLKRQSYKLVVPPQEATVWESYSGKRTPLDVTYQVPALPAHQLLVGDIHCHGDLGAYSSYTDQKDEIYRDGVHAVVGFIDRDPPQFHCEIAIDGHRFPMRFDQMFRGYRRRRTIVPQQWMQKVKVHVDRATYSWSSASYASSNTAQDSRSHGESKQYRPN
jgi:hypothetical protein